MPDGFFAASFRGNVAEVGHGDGKDGGNVSSHSIVTLRVCFHPHIRGDMLKTTVQRLPIEMAEQREKRVPRTNHLEFRGDVRGEWRAEGWHDGFLYLDKKGSVQFSNSSGTSITAPMKMNHLNAVKLDGCKIRIRAGLISGMELTRCKNTEIFIRGTVNTLQIDLCENVTVHFDSMVDCENCAIIHSSNVGNILVLVKGHEAVEIPTSLFDEQQGTVLSVNGDFKSIPTSSIKHSRGYLDIDALKKL